MASKAAIRLLAILSLCWPAWAMGADVFPLFALANPAAAPFPSNMLTVPDSSQFTERRINLPSPNCAVEKSLCLDIATLNALDGFSVSPRLSVPFTGAIDPASVNSNTMFLVELTYPFVTKISVIGAPQYAPEPFKTRIIGINQVVWDPAENTLYARTEQTLRQHTLYVLIVTDGITHSNGTSIKALPAFSKVLQAASPAGLTEYEAQLRAALLVPYEYQLQGKKHHVVAASLFWTMSVTPILQRMREAIRAAPPPLPADFQWLGPGTKRLVFPVDATTTQLVTQRQIGTAPSFQSETWPLHQPGPASAVVSMVAFGKFNAPNFLSPQIDIPQVGTRTGKPPITGSSDIEFILFLPTGPKPPGGWPVAIFGHGFGSSKMMAAPLHNEFNAAGIALLSFSFRGHDGGPLSQVTVQTSNGPVTFASGGRGLDVNNDGVIGSTEGLSAFGAQRLVGIRDGDRQSAAEIMQLIRVIERGVDVDGDNVADLDPNRIYYVGHSNGGNIGTLLMMVEPQIRAAAFSAPSALAWSTVWDHPIYIGLLGARVPPLLNVPPLPGVPNDYNENLPLRDQPPLVNKVPGAIAVQEYFEALLWAQNPGDSIANALYVNPQRILMQFAKGDQHVVNPESSALIRAGSLMLRATYVHWDLHLQSYPGDDKDPHSFILDNDADIQPARQQVVDFFVSDGAAIKDPDGPSPIFETPVAPPLPETWNIIP